MVTMTASISLHVKKKIRILKYTSHESEFKQAFLLSTESASLVNNIINIKVFVGQI